MRTRNGAATVLVVVAGAIIGGLLGDGLQASQALGEMTNILVQKYQVFAIPPSVIDLYVIKFSVGLVFTPNLISILGMFLAFYLFNRL